MSNETQKMKRKMRNLRYREKLKSKLNSQNGKVYTPSKEDIEEKAKLEGERLQELSEKYGTINESCILFRRIYEAKQEHELKQELWSYYFNHIESCFECQKWIRNQGLDLNGVGEKRYEELKGFEQVFRDSGSPSSMGEDRKGWVSICHFCGMPLENGECPNRCCE